MHGHSLFSTVDGFDPRTGLHGEVSLRGTVEVNSIDGYSLWFRVCKGQRPNGRLLPVSRRTPHSDLSTISGWYIRRSDVGSGAARDNEGLFDKSCAYATLYEVLVTFVRSAPILPFVTESLQNLVIDADVDPSAPKSVHLCIPEVDDDAIDTKLETDVQFVREIVSMGRALRERHKLKTRQPLRSVTVVHHDSLNYAQQRARNTHRRRVERETGARRTRCISTGDDELQSKFQTSWTESR